MGHHVIHSRWSAKRSAKILKVASEGQSQLGSVWGRAECNEVTDDFFVGRSWLEKIDIKKKISRAPLPRRLLDKHLQKRKAAATTNWD